MRNYIIPVFQAILFCGLATLTSCNLEKDVTIDLPPYEKQLVVEAYIEPGQPYKLLLTETDSYFDNIRIPLVNNAQVLITHNGVIDTLKNEFSFNTTSSKLYNYRTDKLIMPASDNGEYTLQVIDSAGRKITGSTKLLPVVKFDTIEWKFNDDSLAFLLMKFTDAPETKDFYRLIINLNKPDSASITDFNINDDLLNGTQIPIGTGPRFERGDTVYLRLYHIEEKYYNYLQSVEEATSANGNPFAQPSIIRSGVEGGIGVFTGLSVDKRTIIIK